jgi:hypothetical protein
MSEISLPEFGITFMFVLWFIFESHATSRKCPKKDKECCRLCAKCITCFVSYLSGAFYAFFSVTWPSDYKTFIIINSIWAWHFDGFLLFHDRTGPKIIKLKQETNLSFMILKDSKKWRLVAISANPMLEIWDWSPISVLWSWKILMFYTFQFEHRIELSINIFYNRGAWARVVLDIVYIFAIIRTW